MYKWDYFGWLKHYDFILMDIISAFLAMFFARWIYLGKPVHSWMYASLSIVLVLLDAMILVMFNSMHNVMHRGYAIEFAVTFRHTLILYSILALLLFAFKASQSFSRVTIFLSAILYFLISYISRIAWKRFFIRSGRAKPKKNMILICSESNVERILRKSEEGLDRARFVGVVLTNRNGEGEQICGLPIVANLSNAADYICREWIDEVFFYQETLSEMDAGITADPSVSASWEELPEERADKPGENFGNGTVAALLEQCRLMALPIHIRVPLVGLSDKSFLEKVNGFNVVTFTTNYASPLQLFLKRLMDIAGGLIGSLAALLVVMIVGPIIKKQSPGPVIFKQERVGQNGKHFMIYKIRSMYMDADERKKEFMEQNRISDGMMFKLAFDPRIIGNKILPDGTRKTGIGEFIRSYSLDEFPQFWNVLKSEMSIVGTRPPTVDEWEKYQYRHRARLSFKPGITGMWQVSGRSNITDFEEVVRLDTEYIERWSLGLDIRLILKTVKSIFTKDGAM